MGKTCVICGKPSGMYPLCKLHLQMKNDGKVVKCEDCGKWHLTSKPCDCKKSVTYTELPTEGFETCVTCGAETNGYAFCKKCFKKFSTEEMLDILNNQSNYENRAKSFTRHCIVYHEVNRRAVVQNNSSAFLRFREEKHFVYVDGNFFIFRCQHFNEHRLHLS